MTNDPMLDKGSHAYKIDPGTYRPVCQHQGYFGPTKEDKLRNHRLYIADFGISAKLDDPSLNLGLYEGLTMEQRCRYSIQHDAYRAPEVLLGCGWEPMLISGILGHW
ncbi:uncharacterized protein BDV14DRAFT_204129 [Aspergillus stella-maris]|uniref:uncharacterized protein n=1 Tax=Aspergillus stella-maris TaxID=1810926 RepID=UPI003CCD1861